MIRLIYQVPAMRPPPFPVEGHQVVPVNGIAQPDVAAEYVVVGAGKTAADAVDYIFLVKIFNK